MGVQRRFSDSVGLHLGKQLEVAATSTSSPGKHVVKLHRKDARTDKNDKYAGYHDDLTCEPSRCTWSVRVGTREVATSHSRPIIKSKWMQHNGGRDGKGEPRVKCPLSEWRSRARDAPICLLELLRFGQGGSSLRGACCLMSVEVQTLSCPFSVSFSFAEMCLMCYSHILVSASKVR